MFSFIEKKYTVLARNALANDICTKYADKYMIVKNAHYQDGKEYGDILAILTVSEFAALDLTDCQAPKFYIWEGDNILAERQENRLGIYR